MAKNNNWIILLVIGAIALLAMGVIPMPSWGSQDDGEIDDLYPSDLETTITLNTGDALATTATNANVSYYVFTADGKYQKEGTTSAGTGTFDVAAGRDYKIILYDDTAGTSDVDYVPTEVSFSTNGADPSGRALQTINVDLYKESNATIKAVQDPVDLNANVSAVAGSTVAFDLLIATTSSNALVHKPVVQVDINSTEVEDVKISGLSSVECPTRNSVSAGHKHYCFLYDIDLKASDGIKKLSGTLLIDSATTPATTSGATFTILDTGIYREAGYRTAGYSAFKYGTENPVDDSNIGSADSASLFLEYNG